MTVQEGFAEASHPGVSARRLWRAEAWRLWKTWWMAVSVVLFLMLIGVVAETYSAMVSAVATPASVFEQVLLPEVFHLHLSPGTVTLQWPLHIYGEPALSSFDVFLAMAFVTVTVVFDRTRGAVLYALAGPTSRRTVWSVHTALVLVVPTAAWTVKALVVVSVDAVAHWVLPLQLVAEWWGQNVLFVCAAAAATLFVVAGVGQVVFAFLISIGVVAVPAVVGGILESIGGRLLTTSNSSMLYMTGAPAHPTWLAGQPWIVKFGHFLQQLSPLAHFGIGERVSWGGSGLATGSTPATAPIPLHVLTIDANVYLGLWLIAWFLIWTFTLLYLSWCVSQVTPMERWHSVFIVRNFGPPALWLGACVLALLGANGLARLAGVNFVWGFVIAFVVLGALFHWRWRRNTGHVTRALRGGGP